jgi:hypothetical protein
MAGRTQSVCGAAAEANVSLDHFFKKFASNFSPFSVKKLSG